MVFIYEFDEIEDYEFEVSTDQVEKALKEIIKYSFDLTHTDIADSLINEFVFVITDNDLEEIYEENLKEYFENEAAQQYLDNKDDSEERQRAFSYCSDIY